MTSLTQQAQQAIIQHLSKNDTAIDATAGNGHDTLFLARQVGMAGHIFAFDVQTQAIENTQKLLKKNNLEETVTLLQQCHSLLKINIPSAFHHKISVIMFNLGYLPGSDKTCMTQPHSTLAALRQSLDLLNKKGLLSIMLYPGHRGGEIETEAVIHWSKNLDKKWMVHHTQTPGPHWLLIKQK